MGLGSYIRTKKQFLHVLLYISIAIIATIIIASTIMFLFFENFSLRLLNNASTNALSDASYSSKYMVDSAKNLTLQIYFDPDISSLLYSTPTPTEILAAIAKLRLYANSSRYFVNSIYVYNAVTGMIYSNLSGGYESFNTIKGNFFDQNIVDLLDNMSDSHLLSPIPRQINNETILSNQGTSTDVYSFIISDPLTSNNADSSVIVNISADWLKSTMASSANINNSDDFIVDDQGITVINSNNYNMLTDISREPFMQTILSSKSASGYFVGNVKGEKSIINYVPSDTLNWIFVQVTPYSTVIGQIQHMRDTILLICFFIVLVGAVFSYFLSKKVYKPMGKVLTDLQKLIEEKRNHSEQMKQELLRILLKGEIEAASNSFKVSFESYKYNIELNEYIDILLIKIDHYVDFCENNTHENRNLWRFGIRNIAAELCDKYYRSEAVDFGSDYIVLLVNGKEHNTENSLADPFYRIAGEIQNAVEKALNISVSIVIDEERASLTALPIRFQNILKAANYRMFYGYKCIIQIGNLTPYEQAHKFIIQTEQEKDLASALLLGKYENAKFCYEDIVDHASKHSYSAWNLSMLSLCISLSSLTSSIEKNNKIIIGFYVDEFISTMDKFETVDEVNQYFYTLFSVITSKLKGIADNKYDQLIETIMQIINDTYQDNGLSIESISERVKMSPVYLGRLFKKLTSMTIIEVINGKRLSKARELLLSTNNSIEEVAAMAGFNNGKYFYALFKKELGMTPNQYRQNHMEEIN